MSCRRFHRLISVTGLVLLSLLVGSTVWIRHSSAREIESNSAPVAVNDSHTVHGGKQILPMSNDYDPDNDAITLYTFTPAQHGTVTAISSTTYNYVAAYGYVGSDSFSYTIRDSFGNTATGTVNITVVNQTPVAEDDSYTTHGQMMIAPIANDHDPESDGVTFQTIVTPPQHGTLTQYNATMFIYRPTAPYLGQDSFTYRIQDGYGAVATGTAHITVVNENPVAVEDSVTVHGQLLIWPAQNDTDPEHDSVTFQSIASQPQHGTLTGWAPGAYIYRPNDAYVGEDSFTYTIVDTYGATATGTVHVNVVNLTPIAVPDLFFWKWGLQMTPTANDIDPDADGITFQSIIDTAAFGNLQGISPGTYIYYPNGGTLVDLFTYRIKDGLGLTDTGLSLILVTDDTWNLGKRDDCGQVGRPVDVTTGNMYVQHLDYSSSALNVARTYNSKSQATGLFGRGWSTDYDNSIVADNAYVVHFRQGDGRVIYFYRASTSGSYIPVTPDFHAQLTQTGSGYSLSFLDGSTQQFDSAGKVLSFAERNGNTTALTYGANSFLTAITDPFGRQLSVATDSNGQITSISDAIGTIATYTYGPAHQLLSVTYPDSSAFNFSYDGSYRLLNVTDALSNIVESHQYDGQGRATTSEVQGGVEHYSLNYLSETQTDVTDGLGHITKYTFDKVKGRTLLTRIEGVCGCGGSGSQVQTWTYDDKLNLTAKTDASGHSRSYTYDANGNPLTETDATGTVTYTYNARGEILTRKDQLNGMTTNTYDAQGNLLTSKDALDNTTTLTYNARGQVLTATDPRGKVTTLTYDTNGNVSEREDANHNVTTLTYDARGRITEAEDALSHATSYEYDAAGRIKKVTHPDLSFVSFTYDLAGRRTVVTDERGNPTNYTYDGANRLTSVTDAANHPMTYGYDSMSRLISVTDALSRVTNYEYDDFNRLVKITYPAATTGATRLFETITYNAAGNIAQRTDTAGRATAYTYDNANRITRTTDAANKPTDFQYDALSRITSVTDALSQQYQFAYDAVGRQTQITRGGVSMSYVYDDAGNRTQRTDYNGVVTNYGYDDLNRLTTVTYPDSTTVTYGYDELSRLATATNSNGTVTMSYDNRGRTASVGGVFGPAVSYGYDVGGNRTSMAIGGSTYASYGYDVANRLNTITDSGSLAVTYAYDNTNKLTSRTLPNGITTAYDYDGLNRLTRLRHTTATATLTDNQYGYDNANRISQMTDIGGAHAYSYDSIDRLTSATYPGTTSESYTYDAVGNRTASHISASYTYQPFNKVTNAGGVTFTYDNNGNLLTKVSGTDTTQYAWDFENRLTQVTLPNGTVVNYKYDALGRRIQRTTSAGADERYVYDGKNVVQDLNSSSSVVTSYLNGPGLDNHLRQTNTTTGASYFLTDHLGSTVGLTDASANLVEQITYDSFGNHVASSRTRYTYTGRERDADTGLMYYRARFYDPGIGRFIGSDPIGLNGGINPYAYVGNHPTSLIDPSGLQKQGPQNFLESTKNPFSADHWVINAIWNTQVDLIPPGGYILDKTAQWSWQSANHCLPTSERVWAGGKLVGMTAAVVAAPPLIGRGLGLLGGLLRSGGGAGVRAGATALGDGADAMATQAGAGEGLINPSNVRFTQDSIRATLKSGQSIDELAATLRGPDGANVARGMEPIRLVEKDGLLWTLDNRRLAAFAGTGRDIPFRMATGAEISAEWANKFTTTGTQGWGQFITVRTPSGWRP